MKIIIIHDIVRLVRLNNDEDAAGAELALSIANVRMDTILERKTYAGQGVVLSYLYTWNKSVYTCSFKGGRAKRFKTRHQTAQITLMCMAGTQHRNRIFNCILFSVVRQCRISL